MNDSHNQSDVAYTDGADEDGVKANVHGNEFPGDKMPQSNKSKVRHVPNMKTQSRHKEHR